jgi:amino acid transporter
LFGGILLGMQALSAAQLAKVFPSAGGWYTWIARAFHPRAGFFAGVLFSIWLPPVATLTMSFLAKTVLEPSIKAEYGVDVPWWIWVVAGVALVIFFAYQGISISEKALIVTGLIEIVIMVALAFTGLASPGPGGFSFGPLNPGNFGLASNLFLGVVFSIFAFSGWESTGPLAEESKNPKRNVPIGLVGSVIILMIYFVLVTWGYLVGIGVNAMLYAVNSYLLVTARLEDAMSAQIWLVGSLNGRSWDQLWPVLAVLVICLPLLMASARPLGLLEMGDDAARALGVRADRTRIVVVVLAVALCAAATATAGPIAFVALAAPQLAKRVTGSLNGRSWDQL